MRITSCIFSAGVLALTLPHAVLAQGNPSGCSGAGTFPNPLSVCTLEEFLVLMLDALILILFPFVVLFIVYAAFQLIMAQGEPEKLKKAKRFLLFAIIGGVIILGAKAISLAIKSTVDEISNQTG